jgi:hypothetical protein
LTARHFVSAARALFSAVVIVLTCNAVGAASAPCRLFITAVNPFAAAVSSDDTA